MTVTTKANQKEEKTKILANGTHTKREDSQLTNNSKGKYKITSARQTDVLAIAISEG